MKVIEWRKKEGEYLVHRCAGCNEDHLIPMWGEKPWTFNNDFEKPTLSPSVKHTFAPGSKRHICHYFIRDGQIQYCSDSNHELAGKTVELTSIQS